jgi:hypothetical protein
MRRVGFVFGMLLLIGQALSANAIYTYQQYWIDTDGPFPGQQISDGFSFTVPDYLQPGRTWIDASQFDWCKPQAYVPHAGCGGAWFTEDETGAWVSFYLRDQMTGLNFGDEFGAKEFLGQNILATDGTSYADLTTQSGYASLYIFDPPGDPTDSPEPATWSIVVLGLVAALSTRGKQAVRYIASRVTH